MKDSTVFSTTSGIYTSVRENVYNPGVILSTATHRHLSDPVTVETNRIYQQKSGHEIIAQLDTMIVKVGTLVVANKKQEILVNYFNNPNPFFKISLPVRAEFFKDIVVNEFDAAPRKLIQQQSIRYTNLPNGGGSTEQTTFTYSFRADGYPLTATSVQGSSLYKYVFKY